MDLGKVIYFPDEVEQILLPQSSSYPFVHSATPRPIIKKKTECTDHDRFILHFIIKCEYLRVHFTFQVHRHQQHCKALCIKASHNVLHAKRPVASQSLHPCGSLQTAGLAFYQHHALAAFMWIIEFSSLFLRANKSRAPTQQREMQSATPRLIEDFSF